MSASLRILLYGLASAALVVPTIASAQGAANAPPSAVGTVVVAHGGDSLWNAYVLDVAKQANTGGPVAVSFLMGPAAAATRFQDAVAGLMRHGASQIVVVPLLVSSHSGHYDQIRYLAGEHVALDEYMLHHLKMSGIERATGTVPMRVTPALDDAAEMAQVLADRGRALAASVGATPKDRALLIVGHGPNSAEDYAAWMHSLRPVADSVRAWTGFRDVRVELVRDDAPPAVRAEAVLRTRELIDLQYKATGKEVLVIPVLVSKGSVSRDKVPNDIKGTRSVYAGEPLLPHADIARWIERSVRAATKPVSTAAH